MVICVKLIQDATKTDVHDVILVTSQIDVEGINLYVGIADKGKYNTDARSHLPLLNRYFLKLPV